jgi:hypothetical protein
LSGVDESVESSSIDSLRCSPSSSKESGPISKYTYGARSQGAAILRRSTFTPGVLDRTRQLAPCARPPTKDVNGPSTYILRLGGYIVYESH